MADRRQGERRAREEGVFKINKKDFFIWLVVIIIMICSIGLNIGLLIKNKKYERQLDIYEEVEYGDDEDDDTYDYYYNNDDEEYDDDDENYEEYNGEDSEIVD